MIYSQTSTLIRESATSKNVFISFVVSDNYLEMFSPSADEVEVDCFTLETIKNDLDLGTGVYAADELSFTLNEASIKDSFSELVRNLLLTSATTESRVYVAVWLHTTVYDLDPMLRQNADCVFRGVVQQQVKGKDLLWNSDEFDENIGALREWQFTAIGFDAQLFLDIPARPLITTALTQLQEENKIAHRQAYYDGSSFWGSNTAIPVENRTSKAEWRSLVSLSDVLHRIAQVYNSQGHDVALEFVYSPLGFSMFPLHIAATQSNSYFSNGTFITPALPPYEDVELFRNNIFSPVIDSEKVEAELFGSNPAQDIYVQKDFIKPLKDIDEYMTLYQYEKLLELLIGIAQGLGVFLQLKFVSESQLQIAFVSRNKVAKDALLLRDSTQAELQIDSSTTTELRKRFNGRATQYSLEGADIFRAKKPENGFNDAVWQYENSVRIEALLAANQLETKTAKETGEKVSEKGRVLMSIGISLARITADYFTSFNHMNRRMSWRGYLFSLPVGIRLSFWEDTENGNGVTSNPVLSTMFMQTTGRTSAFEAHLWRVENGINRNNEGIWRNGYGIAGQTIWSPIALIGATIAGESKTFQSMGEYLSAIHSLDKQITSNVEYSITCPYLNAFKKGTLDEESWKNCELGSRITIDSQEYLVTSIERDLTNITTKLKLEKTTSRFSVTPVLTYSESVRSLQNPLYEQEIVMSNVRAFTNRTKVYPAHSTISAGDVVSLRSDETVEKSVAHITHYNRLIGIALNDAIANEFVTVLIEGDIPLSEDNSLSINDRFYLHDTTPYLRTYHPAYKKDRLLAEIGRVTSQNFATINIKQEFVYD